LIDAKFTLQGFTSEAAKKKLKQTGLGELLQLVRGLKRRREIPVFQMKTGRYQEKEPTDYLPINPIV
jgi:hypothetical protein